MDIQDRLPQRAPFLFVDEVVEVTPSVSITAVKEIMVNEPALAGHFPGNPIMPGVLLIEALLQTGHLLASYSIKDLSSKYDAFVIGVEKFRFRQPARPGDLLIMDVQVIMRGTYIGKYAGTVYVGDDLIAEGQWTGMVKLKEEYLNEFA
jgi:3-hydroxyacyl-[acyl-carrier-protein] dehydratase